MDEAKPEAKRVGRRAARGGRVGRGFTMVELLVVAGMGVVLVAIFVPYIMSLRESRARVVCADHLRQINVAMQAYARENGQYVPRVVYDAERRPNEWTAFTGADSEDPFLDGSTVRPNDVTASLWLLVRTQGLSPARFVCPATDDRADPMTNEAGRPVEALKRGNFRGPGNLSYSYANPFSSVGYRTTDAHPPYYAVMADRNPGVTSDGSDVTGVKHDDPALKRSRGNSMNHRRAGQNVLFSYGNVEFMSTPFCGDGWEWSTGKTGDNIYTALRPTPLGPGQAPPANEPGVIGENVGPAWKDDAYLVPYGR